MERKISNRVAKGLATCALSVAKLSANSTCLFISHQPKEPEGLKRQKKSK